jgi:hypothetical protein
MTRRRSRTASAVSIAVETLEGRIVPSGVVHAFDLARAVRPRAVETAARTAGSEHTKTLLTVSAGTLGQPITFDVTVRAAAAAGAPTGTVSLVEHGALIQTLTLSPELSNDARFALSGASYTFTPEPGGGEPYFGKYAVTAEYVPSGAFLKSTGRTIYAVRQPAYAPLGGGVKFAIVTPGSGTPIQDGQTATVLYTGFLAKNGDIFDDSDTDGQALTFTLGSGQIIPGFDEGTLGMQVDETRIIRIPPAEGYGRTANGPIPANSTLVFLVTLESIN